jgi:hypothetical protein
LFVSGRTERIATRVPAAPPSGGGVVLDAPLVAARLRPPGSVQVLVPATGCEPMNCRKALYDGFGFPFTSSSPLL